VRKSAVFISGAFEGKSDMYNKKHVGKVFLLQKTGMLQNKSL